MSNQPTHRNNHTPDNHTPGGSLANNIQLAMLILGSGCCGFCYFGIGELAANGNKKFMLFFAISLGSYGLSSRFYGMYVLYDTLFPHTNSASEREALIHHEGQSPSNEKSFIPSRFHLYILSSLCFIFCLGYLPVWIYSSERAAHYLGIDNQPIIKTISSVSALVSSVFLAQALIKLLPALFDAHPSTHPLKRKCYFYFLAFIIALGAWFSGKGLANVLEETKQPHPGLHITKSLSPWAQKLPTAGIQFLAAVANFVPALEMFVKWFESFFTTVTPSQQQPRCIRSTSITLQQSLATLIAVVISCIFAMLAAMHGKQKVLNAACAFFLNIALCYESAYQCLNACFFCCNNQAAPQNNGGTARKNRQSPTPTPDYAQLLKPTADSDEDGYDYDLQHGPNNRQCPK